MEEQGWTIAQFIWGMVGVGIGFIIVWKADLMIKAFGRIPFAEKYLGTSGGTRLFYKLLGVFLMIIGMMHGVGLLAPTIEGIVEATFGQYY